MTNPFVTAVFFGTLIVLAIVETAPRLIRQWRHGCRRWGDWALFIGAIVWGSSFIFVEMLLFQGFLGGTAWKGIGQAGREMGPKGNSDTYYLHGPDGLVEVSRAVWLIGNINGWFLTISVVVGVPLAGIYIVRRRQRSNQT